MKNEFRHIFTDLYPTCVCCERQGKSVEKRISGRGFQIYERNYYRKRTKSIIVNGVEDHVHLFIGLKPSMRLSDLVRDIKNNTTNFINEKNFLKSKFSWQEGYGAFSYSQSHIESVYQYILNQEKHHEKKSFKEEYLKLLEKYKIEFKEEYLFDFLEDGQ